MRVAAAIAMSGGYTYRAQKNSVQIMRSEGETFTGSHDIPLYPGDVIEVYERFF